jgi:hypothetical protein
MSEHWDLRSLGSQVRVLEEMNRTDKSKPLADIRRIKRDILTPYLGSAVIHDIRLALLASQARKETLTRRVGGLMDEIREVISEYKAELSFIQGLSQMCPVSLAQPIKVASVKNDKRKSSYSAREIVGDLKSI